MPDPDHPAPYLSHYRALIDRVGATFEATGWRSREFQRERFRVFCEMQDFTGQRVIDAGAGQADFAAYLIEHGVSYEEVIALDAMPEMVGAIAERELHRVTPRESDFASKPGVFMLFGPVDSIVFSGSLNTLTQDRALEVLERAWDAARVSLVFNFLSDRAPEELLARPTLPAHRFSAQDLIDWALQRTPGVRFRQDYLGGHDATIAMLK